MVGDDDEAATGPLQAEQALGGSGAERDARRVGEEMAVFDDGAVAVEEGERTERLEGKVTEGTEGDEALGVSEAEPINRRAQNESRLTVFEVNRRSTLARSLFPGA
ncbi:MAG: hypothetical protein IPL39_09235 [Opitutaceae bacterium]|nr:hypothetical protein [Opitutaceae bacterium]